MHTRHHRVAHNWGHPHRAVHFMATLSRQRVAWVGSEAFRMDTSSVNEPLNLGTRKRTFGCDDGDRLHDLVCIPGMEFLGTGTWNRNRTDKPLILTSFESCTIRIITIYQQCPPSHAFSPCSYPDYSATYS